MFYILLRYWTMISIFRTVEDDPRTMDYVPQQNNNECVKELTKEQKKNFFKK